MLVNESGLAETNPRFAGSEAEHGDEGSIELSKLHGGFVGEEGDPHNRIWSRNEA